MNANQFSMTTRHYPIGAELTQDGISFRVWVPDGKNISLLCEGAGEFPLFPQENGYFATHVADAGAGTRYRYRLDQDETLYPDPASRSQPDGPHGSSEVIDPSAFEWDDANWAGVQIHGQVIYELHVGTFTPEGTWTAAIDKLPKLKGIGITLIEMMPVNAFPGKFGWGYDGVDLFAPTQLYGTPDDLRRFINAAHAFEIGVILDVVYNHLGPDGNFLSCFSKDYFTDRYKNDWGQALNFDGVNAHGMRDLIITNAAYWIEEFHFDGLRLDATQNIMDASQVHVITALTKAARLAAGKRSIIVIGENEVQETDLVRSVVADGYGIDALWNDDLHHSVYVAVTGHNEAYYEDHAGSPQELISAAKYGFLFQGQRYAHQNKCRGTPAFDISPPAFVNFIQNHDQVANSAKGLRFHQLTSPGRARAVTAYILLSPGTPMLFQGQEFFASSPFLYFADYKANLADCVRTGREEFLGQFPSTASPGMRKRLAAPDSMDTFQRSKLNWSEFDSHAEAVALHRDLIHLRRNDSVFSHQKSGCLDGAVIASEAFALRLFGEDGDDRLLLINLGCDLFRRSFAEPLIAPPRGRSWSPLWSSESPEYGGSGVAPIEIPPGWRIPGHAAVVLSVSPQLPHT